MKTLVWIEHDNVGMKDASLAAITAASKLGEVHAIVAGHNCGEVAKQAALVAGMSKVHVADDASLANALAENVAPLIVSALSGEHLQAMPPLEGWLALAYLTVFGSIIAFNAYMYLLKHVRPAAATSYAYVNPAVAVLLGIVFVGESIGLEEALAMLVIISAVLLISLPQWRKPKPEIR